MSNNEILENIFESVSRRMIDEYLKEINVSKKDSKYHYSTNLEFSILKNSILRNIDSISNKIANKLNIKDNKSIYVILKNYDDSEAFDNELKRLTTTFVSTKKLNSDELNKIYKQHLKFYLMSGQIKEKILALASENNFKDWVMRRWKVVGSGYAITLFVLAITYYVFINNDESD